MMGSLCGCTLAIVLIFIVGAEEGIHWKPLRPRPAEPHPCHLVVACECDLETVEELNHAAVFLRSLPILLEVASLHDAAYQSFQEITPGTLVSLHVGEEERRLSDDELKLLRKSTGAWERWAAILEIHCLAQVQRHNVFEDFLFPKTNIVASFLGLRRTAQGLYCLDEQESDSRIPVYANLEELKLPNKDFARQGGTPGLGNCPSVMFIPSSPGLKHRRQMLRRTWLGDFPGMLRPLGRQTAGEGLSETTACMDYFFLTGWPSDADRRNQLTQERDENMDLITDCSLQDAVPHYGNLQHKFFKGLRAQLQLFPHAEYFVRASDDTYVHAPRLMNLMDTYGSHRLYLGREVSGQSYRSDWSLHEVYNNTFGHVSLPKVMLGDVVAISVDVAGILLEAQEHFRHWAHFDDTVGIWLSAADRIRRMGALRVDKEWVEYRDVIQGNLECPVGDLVVSHMPSWKDWQNQFQHVGRFKEVDPDSSDIHLEFTLQVHSMCVRDTGDPCLGDATRYQQLYKELVEKLVKLSWDQGLRFSSDQPVDCSQHGVLHAPPSKPWQGFSGEMDISGREYYVPN